MVVRSVNDPGSEAPNREVGTAAGVVSVSKARFRLYSGFVTAACLSHGWRSVLSSDCEVMRMSVTTLRPGERAVIAGIYRQSDGSLPDTTLPAGHTAPATSRPGAYWILRTRTPHTR